MRRTLASTISALATSILLISSARDATADDPRKTEAEALYAEAKTLHERERYAEALEKFQYSYKVYPSPNTLVAVAREEQLLKRNLAALRHLREALKQPLLSPNNVPAATQRVAELEPLLGRVAIRGPAGVRVHVEDLDVRLPLEEPLDFEPGPITIRGELEGKRYAARLTAEAGQIATAELKLEGSADTIATPPPSYASEGSSWTPGKTLGVVLGVASLASFGGALGLRLAASSEAESVREAAKDPTAAQGCEGVGSPACDRARSSADSERALKNASTGLLVGGGVLAAGALGFFFLWPRSRPTSHSLSVHPSVGAGFGAVSVHGHL